MAQTSTGNCIEDVYRGVINDVISYVKEAFLDENVDVDVLQQLKLSWESKVKASGAVDLDGPKNLPPPIIRTQNQRSSGMANISRVVSQHQQAALPSTSIVTPTSQSLQQNTQQQQQLMFMLQNPELNNTQQMGISQILNPDFLQQQNLTGGNNLVNIAKNPNQMGSGNLTGTLNNSVLNNATILTQGGNTMQLPAGFRIVSAPGKPPGIPNAALSNAQNIVVIPAGSSQQNLNLMVTMDKDLPLNSGIKSNAKLQTIRKFSQLDGGPGMTDSSSSEEEDDDAEVDQLRRFQKLENDKLDDGDATEEDPLNSDDDQSDDEDLETLFEAKNVVVCQFEKVHRARNKWKFTLKDGVMRIDGKEYCFQKCSGEAEW